MLVKKSALLKGVWFDISGDRFWSHRVVQKRYVDVGILIGSKTFLWSSLENSAINIGK